MVEVEVEGCVSCKKAARRACIIFDMPWLGGASLPVADTRALGHR